MFFKLKQNVISLKISKNFILINVKKNHIQNYFLLFSLKFNFLYNSLKNKELKEIKFRLLFIDKKFPFYKFDNEVPVVLN